MFNGQCQQLNFNDWQNNSMQIRVEVPSSQHVAAIVGIGGAKIKELRARTLTYIKTPNSGQPPVFIIVGREPGVYEARDCIQAAAEQITCQLMKNQGIGNQGISSNNCFMSQPVPPEAVSLVTGQHSKTLREIEKITNTVIQAPPINTASHAPPTNTAIQAPHEESQPRFKVFGAPRNVVVAKDHIVYMAERMNLSNELRNVPFPKSLAYPLRPQSMVSAPKTSKSFMCQHEPGPMADQPFTEIRRRVQSPALNLLYPMSSSPPLCSPQTTRMARK